MRGSVGPLRFLIAGGGTGGHLFPGIAAAQELEKRFEGAKILFVAGRRRLESGILSRYGYRVISVDVEGVKGRGGIKALTVLARLPRSFIQSISLMKSFFPDLVLGMGGYAAGPVCLAAKFMGIPTAIHEQNAYPGLTNRLLARFVDRVFISFEESTAHFKGGKLRFTGNPVRQELFLDEAKQWKERGPFTILVVGGSQGARSINKAFAEALAHLAEWGKHPRVIHQTGNTDYERVMDDYRNRVLRGELSPFIQDMAAAYHRCDLVVSRAGATTVFELAALGKPSVLIPYPHATNQHQEFNARGMARAGGAELIREHDLTGEGLAKVLMKYMEDPVGLKDMGAKARKLGQPNASRHMVDHVVELIEP
jgi:UDP-N-acetylglucosamine--N-acetylmuramyl-(pentapeptide) pyrophosphoryl-undecaprenol N-acetylglucosamine transferase